jgi:hypothetical protein
MILATPPTWIKDRQVYNTTFVHENVKVETSMAPGGIQVQEKANFSSKDHFAQYVEAQRQVASCDNEMDTIKFKLALKIAKLAVSEKLLVPDVDASWQDKSDWLVRASRLYITEPQDAKNLTEAEARVLLECHNLIRFQDSRVFLMALAKEGDRGTLSDCVAHSMLDVKITGVTLARLWFEKQTVQWGSTDELHIRVASAKLPRKYLQALLELSFRDGSY